MGLVSKHYTEKIGKIHYLMKENNDINLPYIHFLHGGSVKGQNTDFWDPIKPLISKYCNPIYSDRMNHGSSEYYGKNKSASFKDNYQIISSFHDHLFEELSISSIILVGRSAGGGFALEYTKNNPDKVEGLGLIAPAGFSSSIQFLETWNKPIDILWDTEDPVVKFPQIMNAKHLEDKINLFSIGKTDFQTVSFIDRENNKVRKSHMPEIHGPQLFEEFLRDLISRI